MTEAAVLQWFHDTPLGHVMQTVPWLFGICETLHFIGLSTLIGAIFIVDLRMLGFFKSTPLREVEKLIPVAVVGFAINAFTGLCFFTFDPPTYWHNTDFRMKMGLIVIAGLNALWFAFAEAPKLATMPPHGGTSVSMRVCAGLSIGIWIAVIICGRLLEIYAP